MDYQVWGRERRFALEYFETETEPQRASPLHVEDVIGRMLVRGEAG
jgi:hypothetical protein